MQAQESNSRPRILFGIGDEGGRPIYKQAHGLRVERPSRIHRHRTLKRQFLFCHITFWLLELIIQGWISTAHRPYLRKSTTNKKAPINGAFCVISSSLIFVIEET